MSLIISLGTNLGQLNENLKVAINNLALSFELIASSPILETKAVDYENQSNFLNQLLEFKIPNKSPEEVLKIILDIEIKMGRIRKFKYGPRLIDIDIIFWGNNTYSTNKLQIPHPKYLERDFIIKPFQSLPYSKHFLLNQDSKATQSIIKTLT